MPASLAELDCRKSTFPPEAQTHLIRSERWLLTLIVFIAAVSVHDAALVVLNHDLILEFERNPLGRWLIELNGDRVWLFVSVKLFGTALACSLLIALHEREARLGIASASGLAAFQAMLLLYLVIG